MSAPMTMPRIAEALELHGKGYALGWACLRTAPGDNRKPAAWLATPPPHVKAPENSALSIDGSALDLCRAILRVELDNVPRWALATAPAWGPVAVSVEGSTVRGDGGAA